MTLFLLNLVVVLLCGSRFLKKKQFSWFEISTFFKVGEIMVWKYGDLLLPGIFPGRTTPAIDFTDEAVVQCDIPVAKILL